MEWRDFSVSGPLEHLIRDVEMLLHDIASSDTDAAGSSETYRSFVLPTTNGVQFRLTYYSSAHDNNTRIGLYEPAAAESVACLLSADVDPRRVVQLSRWFGAPRLLLITSIFEDSDLLGDVSRSTCRMLLSVLHLAAESVGLHGMPVIAQVYSPSRGSFVGIVGDSSTIDSRPDEQDGQPSGVPAHYVTRYKTDSLPLWHGSGGAVFTGTATSPLSAAHAHTTTAGHGLHTTTTAASAGNDSSPSVVPARASATSTSEGAQLTSPAALLKLFCSKLYDPCQSDNPSRGSSGGSNNDIAYLGAVDIDDSGSSETSSLMREFGVAGTLAHTWRLMSSQHNRPPPLTANTSSSVSKNGASAPAGLPGQAGEAAAPSDGGALLPSSSAVGSGADIALPSSSSSSALGLQGQPYLLCAGIPQPIAALHITSLWASRHQHASSSSSASNCAAAAASTPSNGGRPLHDILDRSSDGSLAYRDLLSSSIQAVRCVWAPGTTIGRCPRLWQSAYALLGGGESSCEGGANETETVAVPAASLLSTSSGDQQVIEFIEADNCSVSGSDVTYASLKDCPEALSILMLVQATLGALELHQASVQAAEKASQREASEAAAAAAATPAHFLPSAERARWEASALDIGDVDAAAGSGVSPPVPSRFNLRRLSSAISHVDRPSTPVSAEAVVERVDDDAENAATANGSRPSTPLQHQPVRQADSDAPLAPPPEDAAYALGRASLQQLLTTHNRQREAREREERRQRLAAAAGGSSGNSLLSPGGAAFYGQAEQMADDSVSSPAPLSTVDEAIDDASAQSASDVDDDVLEQPPVAVTYASAPSPPPRMRKRDRLRARFAAAIPVYRASQAVGSTIGSMVSSAATASVGALTSILLASGTGNGDFSSATAAGLLLADDVSSFLRYDAVMTAVEQIFGTSQANSIAASDQQVAKTCSPSSLLARFSRELSALIDGLLLTPSASLAAGGGSEEESVGPDLLKWLRQGIEHSSGLVSPTAHGSEIATEQAGRFRYDHSDEDLDADEEAHRPTSLQRLSSALCGMKHPAKAAVARRLLLRVTTVLWAAFVSRLRSRWEGGEAIPYLSSATVTSSVGASADVQVDMSNCLLEQKLQLLWACASARNSQQQLQHQQRPSQSLFTPEAAPSQPSASVPPLILPSQWAAAAAAAPASSRSARRNGVAVVAAAAEDDEWADAAAFESGSDSDDSNEFVDAAPAAVDVRAASTWTDAATISMLEVVVVSARQCRNIDPVSSYASRPEPMYLMGSLLSSTYFAASGGAIPAPAAPSGPTKATVTLQALPAIDTSRDLQLLPPSTEDEALQDSRMLARLGLGTLSSPHRRRLSPAIIQSDMAAFKASAGARSIESTSAAAVSLSDFFRWYFPSEWQPANAQSSSLLGYEGGSGPLVLARAAIHSGAATASAASGGSELLPSDPVLQQLRAMEGSFSDALGGCSYKATLAPLASPDSAAGSDGSTPLPNGWTVVYRQTRPSDPSCRQRLALWQSLWDASQSLAASAQRPLFNPSLTGEVTLDWLETLTPTELCSQLLAAGIGVAGDAVSSSASTISAAPFYKAAVTVWRETLMSPLTSQLAAFCLSSSGPALTAQADDGGNADASHHLYSPTNRRARTERSRRRDLLRLLTSVTVDGAGGLGDLLTYMHRVEALTSLLTSAAQGHNDDAIALLAQGIALPGHTINCGRHQSDRSNYSERCFDADSHQLTKQRSSMQQQIDGLRLDSPLLTFASGGGSSSTAATSSNAGEQLVRECSRLLAVGPPITNTQAPLADPPPHATDVMGLQARRAVCELLHHYCAPKAGQQGAASTGDTGSGQSRSQPAAAAAAGGFWAALSQFMEGARNGGTSTYSDRASAPPPHAKSLVLTSGVPRNTWGGAVAAAATANSGDGGVIFAPPAGGATTTNGSGSSTSGPGGSVPELRMPAPRGPLHRLFAQMDGKELRLAQAVSEGY